MTDQDRSDRLGHEADDGRSPVRPYALTGGRTAARLPLPPETVVVAADGPPRPRQPDDATRSLGSSHPAGYQLPEADRIVGLCRPWSSVAEISAALHLPLGVVRILLSDLADAGRVQVHPPSASNEDTDQLERALRELRKRI